jgi:predicted O-methyltransferase YrrM
MLDRIGRALWYRLPMDLRWSAWNRLPPAVQRKLRALSQPRGPQQRTHVDGPPVAAIGTPRDPIPAILASAENEACIAFFTEHAGLSMLSAHSRALLYQVIRLYRPTDVVEIGAFRGGTTQALARALAANGAGTVHAIDPFNASEVRRAVKRWPKAIQPYAVVYAASSMGFFLAQRALQAGLILVDGNHDYEYAAYDIAMSARHLTPGGFIFIDNVSQPGPFEATRDFLRRNPEFFICGGSVDTQSIGFDQSRRIHGTDFIVLRSETFRLVQRNPRSFGAKPYPKHTIRRAIIEIEAAERGTLAAQAVLRGFGPRESELVASGARELTSGAARVELPLPIAVGADHGYYTAELLLTWDGATPLKITGEPVIE